MVHDLIDGVDRLAFAGAAADVEDAGNQMVVHVSGIGEPLKFEFLPGNEAGNANGLATVAADDGAEFFRGYRGCHENDSLEFGPSLAETRGYRKAAGVVQLRIGGKAVEKSDRGHKASQ
jgi:hypothetical protein